MSKFRFHISTSLDGYVAGPNMSEDDPLGEGGPQLHEWMVPLRAFKELQGQDADGEVNASTPIVEGMFQNVGATIISIDVDGEPPARAPAPSGAQAAGAAVAPRGATTTSTLARRGQATPAVRQLAKLLGVAIESMAGTGPGGAITAEDVKRASAGPAPAQPASGGATAPPKAAAPAAAAPGGAPAPAKAAPPGGPEQRVPLRGLKYGTIEQSGKYVSQTLTFVQGIEIEKAKATLAGSRRVAANTPVLLESARTAEQQATARYRAGLGTIVEVAEAQRLLSQAEIDDSLARLGIWRAMLGLAAAQGDLTVYLQTAGK